MPMQGNLPSAVSSKKSMLSDGLFWILAILILCTQTLFSSGKELFGKIHFGLHGPGGYWAFQWTRDYTHGFTRRGFLGELVRLVGLDNANYLAVTLLSWCITLLLFLLFAQSLRRLLGRVGRADSLQFTVLLLLSPLTVGMLIEIVGDPFLAVLVLYLLLHRLLARSRLSSLAEFLLCAVFGVVSILVHEASIFFFAPAIAIVCLFLRDDRKYAALIGYLAGAIPCVILVVFATQHAAVTGQLPSLHWHGIIVPEPIGQYPSFSALVATDDAANFGHGIYGICKMIYRFVGCLILPAFLSILLVRFRFGRSRSATRTAAYAILLPALCCLPLFLIAHDWGRFFSFQFILASAHLSAWKTGENIDALPIPQPIVAMALLIAGITTTPASLTYRVLGLSDSRPILAATVLIVGGSLLALAKWKKQDSEAEAQLIQSDGNP